MREPIGGGIKKVLYTLETIQKMGVRKAAKALGTKNTCKACALGMGGQNGGMRNEMGEFPSVCNKSVQAQSSDTRPAIPSEIFEHPISELKELTERELDRLGRLGNPVYKAASDDRFRPIDWDDALDLTAERLAALRPDRTFFYASGRSSNEAAFLFQLLARVYGTNNVSNCSFYCHQATSAALGETIGTGTATVELADLKLCDLVFVIGANPSSNHPRFIHQLKALRDRGGHVIIINPAREPGLVRFAVPKSPASMLAGGSEIASLYVQPRIGGDIALFKGVAKAVLESGSEDKAFIRDHADGFAAFSEDAAALSWDEITAQSGVPKEQIEALARMYSASKASVFAWGMGMTHHTHGVENVEYVVNLALLRGMVGRRGAGLLPLRGHSNVQGVGTIGVKPVLPEDVLGKMEELFGVTLPQKPGLDTMASMQAASRGEVDAAVLMGGNLYAANPNSTWAARAINQIPFTLSLTTTLNASHVHGADGAERLILPVTARDEEWEPTTQESMFNYVRLSDGGVERLENVRPESVILADIAMRLAPESPIDFKAFKRHQKLRKAIAEIIPDLSDLADIDVAKREFHIKNRLMHTPRFNTPNGRVQFKVRGAPAAAEAPFVLTTVRSEGQFNSIVYEETDSYRGDAERWSILMNAEDISALGLVAGRKAHIRSEQGVMENVRVTPFNLPRGCVMAYYPEANILTSTDVDPRSKTPSFKATGVWIEAV